MEYEVKTELAEDGNISQKITLDGNQISHQVLEVANKQTTQMLQKMGWADPAKKKHMEDILHDIALWADNPIGDDPEPNYSAIIELAKIGMGEPDEDTE